MRILKEYDVVGAIMKYESGKLSDLGELKLFSNLIKSGKIYSMQGHYGRNAKALIADGRLDKKGNITSKAKENGLREGASGRMDKKKHLKESINRQH
jgi:hypothetical protein